jgi:hypothetical protein
MRRKKTKPTKKTNPKPNPALLPRAVTITPALRGFLVSAGCQSAVYEDPWNLCEDLYLYLTHPRALECWMRSCVRHGVLMAGANIAPPPPAEGTADAPRENIGMPQTIRPR